MLPCSSHPGLEQVPHGASPAREGGCCPPVVERLRPKQVPTHRGGLSESASVPWRRRVPPHRSRCPSPVAVGSPPERVNSPRRRKAASPGHPPQHALWCHSRPPCPPRGKPVDYLRFRAKCHGRTSFVPSTVWEVMLLGRETLCGPGPLLQAGFR